MPAKTGRRSGSSGQPAAREVLGRVEPRLWTRPRRRLTRATTKGFEVADFADQVLGEPLLPWQRWLVIHALELNPDGTYRFRVVLVLVARQNGKSSVKRTVSLWRLYLDDARTILGTAQDLALAREQMGLCKASIFRTPDLFDEYADDRNVNGDEMFWLADESVPRGSPREAYPRYVIRATNRRAGRGLSIDELNIDELREQYDWQAWSALSKTIRARRNAQIWGMSNAGDDRSVVLNGVRDAALNGRDDSIFIAEWSAPDGCELDDVAAIAQANPSLGHMFGLESIMTDLATDPPQEYRAEVLCQRVDTLDGAVDMAAWQDCKDAAQTLESLRDRVAAVVDVSPDGGHVSLLAAAQTDDGRVRVEPVAAWDNTDKARSELPGRLERVNPAVTGWFPGGPAAALKPVMQAVGADPIRGEDINAACMGFADLVTARRVIHSDDPLLNAHVAGATKLYVGDGWRFVRKGVGHCDAAYAAAGATHLALTLPVEKKVKPVIVAGRRAG